MSPEYDALSPIQKELLERTYNSIRETAIGLANTTVHYKFDKRLEFDWNMVIGGT